TYFVMSRRRRHTSCLSDWSSDVCSSDLPARGGQPLVLVEQGQPLVLVEQGQPAAAAPPRHRPTGRAPHRRARNGTQRRRRRPRRSEERREGKSVDRGGGRAVRKKREERN